MTKDIPPYSVYIGNKVVKKRFPDEIVVKLLKIDWTKISHQKGDDYEKYVNTQLTESNLNEILSAFTGEELLRNK